MPCLVKRACHWSSRSAHCTSSNHPTLKATHTFPNIQRSNPSQAPDGSSPLQTDHPASTPNTQLHPRLPKYKRPCLADKEGPIDIAAGAVYPCATTTLPQQQQFLPTDLSLPEKQGTTGLPLFRKIPATIRSLLTPWHLS